MSCFLQVVDPKLASYGMENHIYAVIQLARTTMCNELGNITLHKTFEDRDKLIEKLVVSCTRTIKFFFWGGGGRQG